MSHANGARRRSGARESVSGSPRGEAPRIRLEATATRLIFVDQRRHEKQQSLNEIADREVDPVQLQIDDRRTEQDCQRGKSREKQALGLALDNPGKRNGGHGTAHDHRDTEERERHLDARRHRQVQTRHHASGVGNRGQPFEALQQAGQGEDTSNVTRTNFMASSRDLFATDDSCRSQSEEADQGPRDDADDRTDERHHQPG